jgi:hypothetical protein
VKKLFKMMMVLLIAITLYACGGNTVDLELDPPTNVQINNGVITWTAVSGIEEYVVVVGTQQFMVTTTQFNLNSLQLSVGSYSIHVLSKKDDKVSLPSNTVNFVVEEETVVTELGVPQNVSLVNGVLSWSAVAQADSYVVTVGVLTYTVTTLSFNLNAIVLPTGTYSVFVRAKSGSLLSANSPAQSYTVAPVVTVSLVATLLKMIDPELEENMDEDDFDDEWAYKDYLRTRSLVAAFAYSTNYVGMADLEVVAMFAEVMHMANEMEQMDGPMMMFVLLGIFDMGLDNEDLAFILMNLAGVAMNIAYESSLDDILYREQEILLALDDIETYLLAASNFIGLLESNTPSEYLPQLDAFLAFEQDYYNDIYGLIEIIQYYIIPAINNNWNDTYFFDYHPYAELFYIILSQMKLNNSNAFDQIAQSVWFEFGPLLDLSWRYNNLYWQTDSLNRAIENSEMIIALQDVWNNETELIEAFMLNTLNYINDLYLVIDMDMFAFLESGDFTLEEIFILKDELVNILLDTLPDVESFATLYEAMIVIGSALTDTNLDTFLPYKNFIASVDRQMIELALLFIDSVDQATFEELMMLAENLVDEEYIMDEWGGYYTSQPNIENIVALALLVLNHIDEFYTDQALKIAAFNALVDSETLKNFTITVFNQLKLVAVNEMSEEESALATMIIDEILVDLDYYYLNFKKLSGITVDLLKEFMNSEGQIIFNIMALQSMEEFEESSIALFQNLIGSIFNYTTIINTAMDLESIENLLMLSRIPLKVAVMMEEIPIEDFDAMFEELVPLFAQLLFNIGMLEQRITSITSTTNSGSLLFTNAWDLVFEMQVQVVVTYILDEIFTQTYVDLVFDTIDLVFDEILVQADLAQLLSDMQIMPADLKLMLIDMVTQIFDYIDAVVMVDWTSPTTEDDELLVSIFNLLFGGQNEEEFIPE